MSKSIDTYQDLLDYLLQLRESNSPALQQSVQVVNPTSDESDTQVCLPAVCIGTVAELEFRHIRSSTDNTYRADELVLMVDSNPFSPSGVFAEEFDLIGNPAREIGPMQKHIYGKAGRTTRKDQTKPEA